MTTDFSRKRKAEEDLTPPESCVAELSQKRQKTTDDNTAALRNAADYLPSPSTSSSVPRPETISLKLRIPQPPAPTKEQKRSTAARKAAATRFASKLQDPYPSRGEIKSAYNLKLLRDYKGPEATTIPSPIKPVIQKSARVTALLRQFPKLDTTTAPPPTIVSMKSDIQAFRTLKANRSLTNTEPAQRLAWKSFSSPVYSTYGAMLESAFPADHIEAENHGLPNDLPEWKKWKTSRFAMEEAKRKKDERERGRVEEYFRKEKEKEKEIERKRKRKRKKMSLEEEDRMRMEEIKKMKEMQRLSREEDNSKRSGKRLKVRLRNT